VFVPFASVVVVIVDVPVVFAIVVVVPDVVAVDVIVGFPLGSMF